MAIIKASDLVKKYKNPIDKSKIFNTARIEALEIDNLIQTANSTMISAAARTGRSHTSALGQSLAQSPAAALPNG